jgi:hypothetical protein
MHCDAAQNDSAANRNKNTSALLIIIDLPSYITTLDGPRRKQSINGACLLIRCLAVDILLLRSFASAGMF